MAAHFAERVLFVRYALIHLANRAFRVSELLFGVLERVLPRIKIALPMRQLLTQLQVGAGQRRKLLLQRLQTSGRGRELFAQVPLAIGGNLELRLRLSATDLTRGSLLARFVLRAFGGDEHLP